MEGQYIHEFKYVLKSSYQWRCWSRISHPARSGWLVHPLPLRALHQIKQNRPILSFKRLAIYLISSNNNLMKSNNTTLDSQIAAIRSFSRFYTRKLGIIE